MTAIPTGPSSAPDVAAALHDLVGDIDRLVSKACNARYRLRHDPDMQMSKCALDETIEVLNEAKLRLRVDASGNHRR